MEPKNARGFGVLCAQARASARSLAKASCCRRPLSPPGVLSEGIQVADSSLPDFIVVPFRYTRISFAPAGTARTRAAGTTSAAASFRHHQQILALSTPMAARPHLYASGCWKRQSQNERAPLISDWRWSPPILNERRKARDDWPFLFLDRQVAP